jgi:hypothetical protein
MRNLLWHSKRHTSCYDLFVIILTLILWPKERIIGEKLILFRFVENHTFSGAPKATWGGGDSHLRRAFLVWFDVYQLIWHSHSPQCKFMSVARVFWGPVLVKRATSCPRAAPRPRTIWATGAADPVAPALLHIARPNPLIHKPIQCFRGCFWEETTSKY